MERAAQRTAGAAQRRARAARADGVSGSIAAAEVGRPNGSAEPGCRFLGVLSCCVMEWLWRLSQHKVSNFR